MSMFNCFAKDLSESLFNSVYSELQKFATNEQAAIYKTAKRKKNYYIGEAQKMFSGFCAGKISLGEVLNFIQIKKAYNTKINVDS